jgi:LPS-assembly lipoprotein
MPMQLESLMSDAGVMPLMEGSFRRRCGLSGRLRLVGFVLLLSVLMTLTGCGFHLRGKVEIPPALNPVFIDGPAGSPVRHAIEDLLKGSDIRLTPKIGEAKLILRILSENRASRVAAVDVNGKTLAYELHYVVRFDAVGADRHHLVPPQTIDLIRNFDNPDVEVLGKQLEQELIYQDFATDAADRILMRLRASLIGRQ